jgi:hypothetical protein
VWTFEQAINSLLARGRPVKRCPPKQLSACVGCGKCCTYPWLIELAPEDKVPRNLYRQMVDGRYMKQRKSGTCAAFDRKTKSCSIYSRRPKICRDFKRGSLSCRELVVMER